MVVSSFGLALEPEVDGIAALRLSSGAADTEDEACFVFAHAIHLNRLDDFLAQVEPSKASA